MPEADVSLRCSILSKSEHKRAAPPEHVSTGPLQGWFVQPLFGHWQVECHEIIYEIEANGPPWNRTLKAHTEEKYKDTRTVFYRKRIGKTIYTAKQIVHDLVPEGTYNLSFRNCQTTSMELVDRIISPREDAHAPTSTLEAAYLSVFFLYPVPAYDEDFSWPWHSLKVTTYVLALSAFGVGLYWRDPSKLFLGPLQFARETHLAGRERWAELWKQLRVQSPASWVRTFAQWAIFSADSWHAVVADVYRWGQLAGWSTVVSYGVFFNLNTYVWRTIYKLWMRPWSPEITEAHRRELTNKLDKLLREAGKMEA